jgi:hypothetical protein
LISPPVFRLWQSDHSRLPLLFEALACLLAARFALSFVPFPRFARHIGIFVV